MTEDQATPPPYERQGAADWPISRIVTAFVAILAVLGVVWVMARLTQFLLLVFAAVVLACVFDTITRAICRVTGPKLRPLALLISVVGLLAVFLGAFVLFGAQFAREIDTIMESIPPAVRQIELLLQRFGVEGSLSKVLNESTQDMYAVAGQVGGYAMALTTGLTDFLLVFVGGIFIAASPGLHRRGLLLLMPAPAVKPAAEFLHDAATGLRGWMLGQAGSSLFVGLTSWIALSALNVPAAGGLGVIGGLLDVIPMVGPIIAAIPAVLLAFTVSPTTALWTLILFIIIQQLQSYVLQPMIQKHAVNVPPSVLLFAVFGAGMLFGPMGVLLAAPLTIISFLFVQRIYVQTLLGKDISVASDD